MGSKAGLTQIFQNQYSATGTQLPVPSTQQNQIVIPNCAEGAVKEPALPAVGSLPSLFDGFLAVARRGQHFVECSFFSQILQ